jgi:hypothetical protein
MKAKELHEIAKSEFIGLLCSGAIFYAKNDMTQLESWYIARENEGCSFYKTV